MSQEFRALFPKLLTGIFNFELPAPAGLERNNTAKSFACVASERAGAIDLNVVKSLPSSWRNSNPWQERLLNGLCSFQVTVPDEAANHADWNCMSAGYEPLALPSPFPPDVVWIGERYAPILPARQREREQERANRLIALALETLGVRSAGPLPHAESGARSWPEGVVGSVSHTHTAVVVAAGPSAHYRTIGIDIERVDRELHPRIEERICRPEERQALTVLSHPEERRLRLLLTFCCKETLFKALSPLVRRYFGYQDARLEFEDDGKVRAGLVTDTLAPFKAGSTFPISTHIHGEYIYSGLALPALQ